MRTEVIGEGRPEYAVVYCVHGDEICGKEAIEKFRKENYDISKPVKFILANEKAYEEGRRFIDKDLNRCFPGSSESEEYEERIAVELLKEVEGMKILDLHSTHSHPEPFGVLANWKPETEELAKTTGVENVVDISYVAGGFVGQVEGVCVECGLTGTEEAAENAYNVLLNFLACNGIIDEECTVRDQNFVEVYDEVEGHGYEFMGKNFEKIEKGDVFARKDDEELVAGESFYPVLMSTDGYDDKVGFKARSKEI